MSEPADFQESTPNSGGIEGAAGDMGVSSERVGHAGPGQIGTDGLRDVGPDGPPADAPPEQSEGGPEDNPDGIPPKAGYPSLDPRADDHPYKDA